jgi:hypothetical protein
VGILNSTPSNASISTRILREILLVIIPLLRRKARGRHRDLRQDVTVSDLELASRHNSMTIERVKRYTTVSMSADIGNIFHVAAHARATT